MWNENDGVRRIMGWYNVIFWFETYKKSMTFVKLRGFYFKYYQYVGWISFMCLKRLKDDLYRGAKNEIPLFICYNHTYLILNKDKLYV